MSIIRGPRPESNWYALDKRISGDERLSWAARGLLVYLLGKPDNWRVSVDHLRKQTEIARVRTGRDGVYALLAELHEAGYVSTSRERREDGTLGPVDYIISESPLPAQPEQDVHPLPAQPDTAQPDTAETTLTKTDRATKTDSSKKGAVAPELPAWLDPTTWVDWHAYRNSRKGWTQKARELSLRTLTKLRDAGHDPRAVIEQSIENGWAGLFPVRGGSNASARRLSAADRVQANADRARRERGEPIEGQAVNGTGRNAMGADGRDLRPPLDERVW